MKEWTEFFRRSICLRINRLSSHANIKWVATSKPCFIDIIRHYTQQWKDESREAGERNRVGDKFGTGKRYCGLDRLTAGLKDTRDSHDCAGNEPVDKTMSSSEKTIKY